jgi:hypothetical protein
VNAFSPHALHFGIYFLAVLLLDVLEIFVFATSLSVVVGTSHEEAELEPSFAI